MTTTTLNELMEFDHVIRVYRDGSIWHAPEPAPYPPTLLDEELLDDPSRPWHFFTNGYTAQDSYRGPIMHDSEFIGGRLERDIRATPGLYVAVVAYWSDENDEEGWVRPEGWAIAHIPDEEA